MKSFQEFITEAKTKEEVLERIAQRDNPGEWVARNSGSTENPNWGIKRRSSLAGQSKRRQERISSLSSEEEKELAKRKSKKIVSRGYEAHHITPTHQSIKLQTSMTPQEWEERKKRDAKLGIYHGHHPKNIMAAKGKNTPKDAPGIEHRAGGAHEIEGKTKDITSGPGSVESAITSRDLIAAAARKRSRERKLRELGRA